MLLEALLKIDREVSNFKGGHVEQAIYKPVADALKSFCRQDAEFSQAVAQSDKTLSDCCSEIAKKAGRAISDLEVYRRAVQFYFAGAEVDMQMTVRVNPAEHEPESGTANIISLSFDDLMD